MLQLPSISIVKLVFIVMLLEDFVSTKRNRSNNKPKLPTTKNILLWCPPKSNCRPFKEFGSGRSVFKKNNCEYQNCNIIQMSAKPPYIDPGHYDAVIFNGAPDVLGHQMLQSFRRNSDQIFIYLQLHPAKRFKVAEDHYHNAFFNWTMTYRLDSDIPWPHFEVNTLNNKTVAPEAGVEWFTKDVYVSHDLLSKLNNKTKLAAWVTDCKCKMFSGRNNFVEELQVEIKRLNYTLSIDIYGACGVWDCPQKVPDNCDPLIDNDYLFYIVMEDVITQDYLSDKVLRGMRNDAVPVIYSGAELNKFLPHGSYLNARALGARLLAEEMHKIYRKRQLLESFFDWKSIYTVRANREPRPACELCKRLHLLQKGTARANSLWHQWTFSRVSDAEVDFCDVSQERVYRYSEHDQFN